METTAKQQLPFTNSPKVMANLKKIKSQKNRRYNKIGEWVRSNSEPVIDLSVLTEEQQKRFWRMALRWERILTQILSYFCWQIVKTNCRMMFCLWLKITGIYFSPVPCVFTRLSIYVRWGGWAMENIIFARKMCWSGLMMLAFRWFIPAESTLKHILNCL